jgi:hypothetical protein
MPLLEAWQNFYIIVGPSAGALIGLQFVVVTLIADMPVSQGDVQGSGAYSTPSVVHFGVVLLLSAIASVPWSGIGAAALVWGLVGLSGIWYTGIVARRLRALPSYSPVFEDWLAHALLPLTAYALLVIAACFAQSHEHSSLFIVGSAALLLLFVGIHNAWDTVVHLVFFRRRGQGESEPPTHSKE